MDHTISTDFHNQRVDRFCRYTYPALTQGLIQRALRKGQIRVNRRRVEAGYRLQEGDILTLVPSIVPPLASAPPKATPTRAQVKTIEEAILYADEEIVVINKPVGLAVQGGTRVGLSLDALLPHLRLVHRLDKDTTGVMVLARTLPASRWLAAAFRSKQVTKHYWALVEGVMHPPAGTIEAKVGEEEALTLYRTLHQAGDKASWVELQPVTGRTHQLRIHCQLQGTPIIGDPKYGQRVSGLSPKLHLHARHLALTLPTGEQRSFTAPLPSHMLASFTKLGFPTE